jgi:hypothetical protein
LKEILALDQQFIEEVLEKFVINLNNNLDVFNKTIVTNGLTSCVYIEGKAIKAITAKSGIELNGMDQ